MFRTTRPALIAVSVFLSATPLAAQQKAAPEISVVTGLAEGDMLNIRATASAIGKVQGRLPNGANLNIFGCSEVGGYVWCRVEEAGNPQLNGWAPGRYLHTPGGELPAPVDVAAVEQAAASGQQPEQAQARPETRPSAKTDPLTEGANGNNMFVAGQAPDAGSPDGTPQQAAAAEPPPDSAPRPDAQAPAPSFPADLMARFGEVSPQPAGEATQPKSAAAIGRTAAADAYRLAFAAQEGQAAQDDASEGDVSLPVEDDQAAAPAGDAAAASGDDGVPLPTPRPGTETGPETVAALDRQPVGAARPAPDGEIPCARYVGQPMMRCAAHVTRTGAAAVDITVTWPDGGTRVISFQGGKPSGSNARGEFRFTREGSLNMIRIGASERFEILDELALGG